MIEVLTCYRRNVLAREGGYWDQDWDFIFWTNALDGYVTEHQALLQKTQPQ